MIKLRKRKQELHPYKIGIISSLPIWFKISFFRWWIVGIAYFFTGFGISFLRPGSYEQMLLIGAVIGLFNHFVISRVVRDMYYLGDEQNPYLSVRRRGTLGILTSTALSMVIVILIAFSYDGINRVVIFIFSLDKNIVYFPAEPLGFALLYLWYDFLWRKLTNRRMKKINVEQTEQNLP